MWRGSGCGLEHSDKALALVNDEETKEKSSKLSNVSRLTDGTRREKKGGISTAV